MKSNLTTRRPAETTTLVAGAIAGLAAHVFDLDGTTAGYLTVLVGAVPAGITYLVELFRSSR